MAKTTMTKSGFCLWPGKNGVGHTLCTTDYCDCKCHSESKEAE